MPTVEELRKKKAEQPARTLDYLRGVKAGMEQKAEPEDPELAALSPEVGPVGSFVNKILPNAVDSPRQAEVRRRAIANLTPEQSAALDAAIQQKANEIGRTNLETGVPAIATGLTGGLGLAPGLLARLGIAGLSGAGGSLAAEAVDPSASAGEAGKRALTNAAVSAGGEGLGSAIAYPFKKLAAGLFRPTPAGAAAAKAIEAEGGVLTPALQSESRPAKLLESVAESSLLGSKAIAEARKSGEKAALAPIERFVDGLRSGYSREELGGIAKEALEGKAEAFKAAASVAYGEVDKVLAATPAAKGLPAVGVSLRALKAEAERMLNSGLGTANATKQLKAILGMADEVSFQQAAEIRSDLLNPVSEVGELLVGKAAGQVKRLTQIADQAMNDSFATASVGRRAQGEALRLWREANALYKEGAELFNARMVKALAAKQPEAVVAAIAQAQKPGTIRTLRTAIGDEQVWKGIQGEFLSDLLLKNTQTAGDVARGTVVSGQKIATALKNFGDPALNELLGAETATAFKNMVKILERSQQRTGAGLGGLNMRFGVEGLAGGGMLLSGGLSPTGAAVFLTPAMIGQLFTNPRTIKLLTQGFTAPAGSAEATRAVAQIGALLANQPPPQPEAQ